MGLVGCLVGAWLAASTGDTWTWALLRQDGAELVQTRFGDEVAFPADSPWAAHAAGDFGAVLLFPLAFAAAALAARRLDGTAALWMACLCFGLATPVCGELARYARAGPSNVEGLLQALGLPQPGPLFQQAVALLLAAAIVLPLRAALRRTSMLNVTAFSLPACAVQLFPAAGRELNPELSIPGAGFAVAAFVALAAGLSAKTVPDDLRVPPPRTLAILGVPAILCLVAPGASPVPDGRVLWTQRSSRNWSVQFEAARSAPDLQDEWLQAAEARLAAYSARLGLPGPQAPIRAYVATSERALTSLVPRRRTSERRRREADAPAIIRVGPNGLPEDPEDEPLAAMRRAWGDPASEAMAQAIARYAIGEFRGESLETAGAGIACEESRYSPQDVFAAGGRYLSPLVRSAVGGAWVERAVGRNGTPVLKRLYERPLSESLAYCEDCVPGCPPDYEPAARRGPAPGYWKGISFSHEGRGANGYGSASADRELGRIRDTGANAVALVPYAFTRAPDETSIRFRTLETDARLARSVRRARELGLRVMLKPHLWSGSTFHGSISFARKERFDAWFEDYRRWILHYARFAEMHRIDILSIGNELAGLTVHEKSWRALVRDVRRVFRGPVTYAAHWESEVGRLAFWDDLDYIGVNFYFPIARRGSQPTRDSPEMTAAAELIARVRDRDGKPVLFTEVGFPALATAASKPWEENRSALDASLQARCYEAWLDRFGGAAGTAGMFWWKWPSDGRGSPFDASHRPLGKPAMDVLKGWFGRYGPGDGRGQEPQS